MKQVLTEPIFTVNNNKLVFRVNESFDFYSELWWGA